MTRINTRGHACFFGFFSVKSWLFVLVMMGGGILLRGTAIPRSVLGVIYVAVGTALIFADRIYWIAVFSEE